MLLPQEPRGGIKTTDERTRLVSGSVDLGVCGSGIEDKVHADSILFPSLKQKGKRRQCSQDGKETNELNAWGGDGVGMCVP